MSPYIVTRKRLMGFTVAGAASRWDVATLGEAHHEALSRRAVATLEEVHAEVREHIDAAYEADPLPGAASEHMAEVPESGGTVGPLPDGTVIEVEATTWPHLATLAGIGGNHTQLLDAFNAQGTRA